MSYGLYQPHIEDRNVRRLYQLKVRIRKETGRNVPMTVLLNRILDQHLSDDNERRVISDPNASATSTT